MFALFQSNPPFPQPTPNRWCGKAIVDEAIAPYKVGRIRYRETYWNARCALAIAFLPGQTVEVVEMGENLTLLVEPEA